MKLTHPDSKQTIEAAPGMAEMYLSQGWTKPAPKSSATRASGKSDTPSRTTTEKE